MRAAKQFPRLSETIQMPHVDYNYTHITAIIDPIYYRLFKLIDEFGWAGALLGLSLQLLIFPVYDLSANLVPNMYTSVWVCPSKTSQTEKKDRK
jgi:hypothetical protein